MMYPEHARPGDLVPSLALDAARSLLPRLDLSFPDLSADAVHQTLKQALEWGKMPRFHEERWECLQAYAKATLPEPAHEALLGWFAQAYTGYHAANPDLSDWTDVLIELIYVPSQLNNLSLDLPQQSALGRFLKAFAKELDADAFEDELDELRNLPPSPWDRKLLARYELVYFDRETGSDPFLVVRQAHKGQALRRALRAIPPDEAVDFPLEEVNRYAAALTEERGSWYPEGVSMCSLAEVA